MRKYTDPETIESYKQRVGAEEMGPIELSLAYTTEKYDYLERKVFQDDP